MEVGAVLSFFLGGGDLPKVEIGPSLDELQGGSGFELNAKKTFLPRKAIPDTGMCKWRPSVYL